MKVEATEVDGRKIFSVRAFNQGIASWLARLPTVWVEGEVTELRRQDRWASVFFTLKDPENGACLAVQMPRGQFDGLRLGLADGERVHVYGRPELYEQRGDFHLRALTIERFGLGAHLASLERLKAKLAAEGLFAAERKRPLPRMPRLIGLVTGNDAAAKRDVLTAITTRFPPAHVLVAETSVQGPRAAPAIAAAIADLCARGCRRDRRRARRRQLRGSAAVLRRTPRPCRCRLPGAGRQRGRPRAGHAAPRPRRRRAGVDPVGRRPARRPGPRRASRADSSGRGPDSSAGRAPDRRAAAPNVSVETRARLRPGARCSRSSAGSARLEATHGRLQALSPRATLDRGYAIVRSGELLVREPPHPDTPLAVEVAGGAFGARAE